MATLEQDRAAFALCRVEEVRKDPGRDNAKYKTQLLKLPARLHNNGLGQTAAYLLAQGEGSHERAIYGWLESWLGERRGIYEGDKRLIDCLIGASDGKVSAAEVEGRYRQASAESRALAVWLKRFAEAFLEGEGQ